MSITTPEPTVGPFSPIGVFIGPLLRRRTSDELAVSIYRLLNSVGIRTSDISRISVNAGRGYARIGLTSKDCEDYAVKAFNEIASVMNFFDLRKLVERPRTFTVQRVSGSEADSEQTSVGISEVETYQHGRPTTQHDDTPNWILEAKPNIVELVPQSWSYGDDDEVVDETVADDKTEETIGMDDQGKEYFVESPPEKPHGIVSYHLLEDTDTTSWDESDKRTGQQLFHASKPFADIENRIFLTLNPRYSLPAIAEPYRNISHNSKGKKKKKVPGVSQSSSQQSVSSTGSNKSEHDESGKKFSNGSSQLPSQPSSQPSTSKAVYKKNKDKSRNPRDAKSDGHLPSTSKPILVDAVTSTGCLASASFCQEAVFYHMHQNVSDPNRHTEFYVVNLINRPRAFRNTIGARVCAMLNARGGVLYVGVDYAGKVIGVFIDQRLEDWLRQDIDNMIKCIRPHVLTSKYRVNFAKVMGKDGKIMQGLKVLEVIVHPCSPPSTPYAFKDIVRWLSDPRE